MRIVWLTVALVLIGSAAPAAGPTPVENVDPQVANILDQTDTLRPKVLRMALDAYRKAEGEGHVRRSRLTIIDYELASFQKRLWVIDVESGRVLYEEWVSHGMGSPRGSGGDMERALSFSNEHGTRKSCLGLFRTAETYQGKHGYSVKLDGLEPGINDRARDRTIVMHSAHYVSEDRAEQHLIGRSWGCPAVRPAISKDLINAINGGSIVWIYYPDSNWLQQSTFLNRVRSGFAKIAESFQSGDTAPTSP
jgi:hypothetical protein